MLCCLTIVCGLILLFSLLLWTFVLSFFFCVFFFKQKTAYEMRISDWSSDVCSSDLLLLRAQIRPRPAVILVLLLAHAHVGGGIARPVDQLRVVGRLVHAVGVGERDHQREIAQVRAVVTDVPRAFLAPGESLADRLLRTLVVAHQFQRDSQVHQWQPCHQLAAVVVEDLAQRSEEHTSELQSLMRMLFAVFYLK